MSPIRVVEIQCQGQPDLPRFCGRPGRSVRQFQGQTPRRTTPNGLLKNLELTERIRTIPDFPIAGILFKDITPLLLDGEALSEAAAQLAEPFRAEPPDVIVAPEARGWIFATAMSPLLGGCGVAVARKEGKLPGETVSHTYSLEYGQATIEMHADSIRTGQRVLLVDDLLATGGTLAACERLIAQMGGQVVGAAFLIELDFLGGRSELGSYPVHTLIHYGAGE